MLYGTCVVVFATLYYLMSVDNDDLALRGADKTETVCRCFYQSIMLSSFGAPLAAPQTSVAALMLSMHRVVAVLLTIALINKRPQVSATT